jgi:hypothetical protein
MQQILVHTEQNKKKIVPFANRCLRFVCHYCKQRLDTTYISKVQYRYNELNIADNNTCIIENQIRVKEHTGRMQYSSILRMPH